MWYSTASELVISTTAFFLPNFPNPHEELWATSHTLLNSGFMLKLYYTIPKLLGFHFDSLVKAHKHRDLTFLRPRGRMTAADYYVWSVGKAQFGAKISCFDDSPYHRGSHHCHHHGHIHHPGHLCHDLPGQSWEGWGSYPVTGTKERLRMQSSQ